jgi:hypothetical protein
MSIHSQSVHSSLDFKQKIVSGRLRMKGLQNAQRELSLRYQRRASVALSRNRWRRPKHDRLRELSKIKQRQLVQRRDDAVYRH